jgi:hypothetical protein
LLQKPTSDPHDAASARQSSDSAVGECAGHPVLAGRVAAVHMALATAISTAAHRNHLFPILGNRSALADTTAATGDVFRLSSHLFCLFLSLRVFICLVFSV